MAKVDFNTLYKRKDNIVVREIVGETLLIPISGELADMERLFTFNSAGLFIWEMLDGGTALTTILDRMVEEYEVDRQTAQQDLEELAGDLLAAGLISAASMTGQG